ncbi:SpoIIE family protein phosphatase [Streptomyces sp. NPDC089173]|uniref:SpoIIE family protein phosphatase n=1 Tax=Streptomyces sp. NPDC089173 TaxID=3154965 RepID=UPI00344E417C
MDTFTGDDNGTHEFSGTLMDLVAALIDDLGTVRQWSCAAARLLGRPADEVCGRPATELFAGSADDALPDDGASALLRDGDGRGLAVRCRMLPLGGTAHRLLLAVPVDRAEASEGEAAALVRALLVRERIGVEVRDAGLRLMHGNFTAAGMLGLPTDGASAGVLEGPDAAAAAGLGAVLEAGTVPGDEARPEPDPSGPAPCHLFTVAAVRTTDRDGRSSGVTVLLTDAAAQWRATQRLRVRHRAAVTIGLSLDVHRTAQDVADVLVPDFADLVAIDLAESVLVGNEPSKVFGAGDLHLRRVAVRGTDGWPAGLLSPGEVFPTLPDRPTIRSLQEGRTVIADRALLDRAIGDGPTRRMLIPENGRSLAVAPLYARGLVLGVIGVWRTDRYEPFDEHDADLLTEIAAHAALSIDNARRYDREHRAAVTLQQSLLPAAATRTPALDAVGRYLPAAGGAEIGGDWFDVLPLPSLRVAMAVGDVRGHGLHAAATMGRLRTAVQTLGDLELAPDELLTRLDELVARLAAEASSTERDSVGATCLVALYDPVTRRCTFASAGHPPPVVVAPDGTARSVPVPPGPPLGVGGLPFETASVELAPDSWIALYTDGLLCGQDGDMDADVDRLAVRIAELHRSGSPLKEACDSLTAEQARRPASDDTALLLARIRPLRPDAVAEWEFPADPATVAEARAAASAKLTEWGLELLDFSVELIVSELVTNAVRYAGGPIGLRLIHDTLLYCEVSDPSNTQPRLRRAALGDEGGRGLFLVAQLSSRWGSRYGQSGKTIWAELETGPT